MLFVCGPTSGKRLCIRIGHYGAIQMLYYFYIIIIITVAVDKCCVLHIGKADKTPAVYLIKNVAFPAVLSCRDLDITITHDLSPSMHISDIVVKAHKRGNAIRRCFMSRNVDNVD